MKTPWYMSVHRQAKVLDLVANRVYYWPNRKAIMRFAQMIMWAKFDQYKGA